MKLRFIIGAVFTLMLASTSTAEALDDAITQIGDYLNGMIPKGDKIAIVPSGQNFPKLTGYIIDGLVEKAVNTRSFSIVDRAQLDAIRAEQQFQASGDVDDATMQRIGQIAGVRTIITVTVTQIGENFQFSVRGLEVESAKIFASRRSPVIPGGSMIWALTGTQPAPAPTPATASTQAAPAPAQAAPPTAAKKPKPKKREFRMGFGVGGFFTTNFGGGIQWEDSGEILTMPYYPLQADNTGEYLASGEAAGERMEMPYTGGGIHLTVDLTYIEVICAFSWGSGKWASSEASYPGKLPEMHRTYGNIGVFAKYPFHINDYVRFYPAAGLEWESGLHTDSSGSYAFYLEYPDVEDTYNFDGLEGRPPKNALNAMWYKVGGGFDFGPPEIFLRFTVLYGMRGPNNLEKREIEAQKRRGRGADAMPGRGLTVRLAFCMDPIWMDAASGKR